MKEQVVTECWAVIEYSEIKPKDENSYPRGIDIYHACYRGKDAKQKAEKKLAELTKRGFNVSLVADEMKPVRPSLPYQRIARRGC